jgi:hypothetical protein
LFNGNDLNDWQIKFKGFELGENFNNTFRVEDGLLRVSYENWDECGGQFGHIFYKGEFSHYRLRVEYRFVGEQVKKWAGMGISQQRTDDSRSKCRIDGVGSGFPDFH